MTHTVAQGERHRFEPILDKLRDESTQRFGFADARLAPVSYEERPFSYLCRAAVSRPGAAAPDLHVFIKIFKPKDPAAGVDMRARVLRDFETTCDVHAFMSPWPELGAVRPLACYDDWLTIVTAQADGVTLLDALQSHATWFPGAAQVERLAAAHAAVGLWLARFQGFKPGDRYVTADSLCEYVDVRLRKLVDHRVMTPDQRLGLLEHLQHLGALVPQADLREVAVHADLAPANILVSDSRIVVLDFAMAGRATALHDISRLYMQLGLLRAKPQFRRAVIVALQEALLRGFDPALSPRRPLFRLLSMMHHVNHLGTLALRHESLPARLLSRWTIAMHRRWIAAELEAGTS